MERFSGGAGMKMKKYIKRLMDIFPNSFINSLNELILYIGDGGTAVSRVIKKWERRVNENVD